MTKTKNENIFKYIIIDIMMLFLFVLLISFSVWISWMYFFRGPVDIETRGYVSQTLKETVVQPTDIERYTLQHFHNLDDAVLKGIEYPSTCVTCHGDYPHNKTAKVRAFFNAHSWFMACEVCHRDNKTEENNKNKKLIYKWLDDDTDIALDKLQGKRGIYGARIVPLHVENKTEHRLDNLITEDTYSAYMLKKNNLNKDQQETEMKKMHQVLNKKPVSCDQCHTEDSQLHFKNLLYSENMSRHLKTLDIGSMIDGYKVFYLPNVLDSQDHRHGLKVSE